MKKYLNNMLTSYLSVVLLLGALGNWVTDFATTPTVHGQTALAPAPANYAPDPCDVDNTVFEEGEEIVYKIYYNWNFVWLPAGEVTFKVNDAGATYHVSAKGRTYPSYEWFFKVRDNYDTYLDKNTLLPITSIRDVQEGGYKLYDKIVFDQERNIASSWRGDTKSDATQKSTYNLSGCMHDLVSLIYYTRNLNYDALKKGSDIPVRLFMDKEEWSLKVKYRGKEANKKVRDHNRTFNTIRLTPQVIGGKVFKEGTEMNIWATDDANRLPVLIESPVSVGSVKVVLKSYKGLKYSLK